MAKRVCGRWEARRGWAAETAAQTCSTVAPSGTSTSRRSRPATSRYRANRATGTFTTSRRARRRGPRAPTPERVGLEGVAAAAGALDLRVLHREPGAIEAVHVVDLGARDVLDALGIDEDADPVRLVDQVAVLLGVLPAQLVGETRTAAAHDPEPQPPLGLALLEAQV